ncbi:nonsense-mediated mRNA decay factor SMG5-like [Acropora muricata]|uniref:nonsense-mediated mRNA decay factor SMG5-like n=1 Tax=Acropora muricata TaxID=159855 RepID=UPI0034E58914
MSQPRMKKALVAEDNANAQGKEGSRLNRSSMQLANRIDIQLRSVVEFQELFHPDAIALRQKLRVQCESLILKHPKEYGRRAEERLWRKAFYDVIQKLRNHRKLLEDGCDALDGVLRMHLSSAAGYYYHLLTHLQRCYHLGLENLLSWGISPHQAVDGDPETISWAVKACQRCLIYLGDIARYQSDLEGADAVKLAERFYSEAAMINPDIGMPQNQLGTLAGTRSYGCEGAYFYLRCLFSKEVFEGAEGNLLRIFEKNRSVVHRIKELPLDEPRPNERIKRFLVYFLYLQDVLFKHENSPDISTEDTGHLCQSVLQDFNSALSVDVSPTDTQSQVLQNGFTSQENGHQHPDTVNGSDGVISGSLMVKLVVMTIATVTRLQSKGAQEYSMAIAFTLSFLSFLIQKCISSFENFSANEHLHPEKPITNGMQNDSQVLNGSSAAVPKNENSFPLFNANSDSSEARKLKRTLQHRRRRRRRKNVDYSFDSYSGSGSDSEESGEEGSDDSDLSEGGGEGEIFDRMSDESDDVYIESESDDENGNTGSFVNTVSSAKQPEKNVMPKPVDNSVSPHTVGGKPGLKSGIFKQNGISVGKILRADLISDVSDTETESSVASRTELLRDCAESNILKAVTGQKLLPAIKVMTDWLRLNGELLLTCVESLGTLLSRLAVLLNMFPTAEQMISAVPVPRRPTWQSVLDETLDKNWVQSRGLPEDMSLLGFTPLNTIHSRLDKKWSRLTRDCHYLEAAVRVQCLRSFGMKLASVEELNSFNWDRKALRFIGPQQMTEPGKQQATEKHHRTTPVHGNHDRRSRVMKAMAQQLLQSEVAALESNLKTAPSSSSTVYVVPDATALCTQLHLLRRLVTTERMVIIIPIQVISALDELKKYDSGAREATKYLEQEFKRGNRWIRAQKEDETLDSGKRRGRYEDVAVWRFGQIVNCCQYFVKETGRGLVTLLTGETSYELPKKGKKKGVTSNGTQATPETVELARSCGVGVESLRAFCSRFFQQSKSVT